MFEVDVNGLTQRYRSKPIMNVDITKPFTYDYMPEGYPSKSTQTVTLMEEQEVAFTGQGGTMGAASPVNFELADGDKLTVVWDGVSYDAVVKERVISGPGGNIVEKMFGNLAIIDEGESEDYPFVCSGEFNPIGEFYWITTDTATSHTIKVMRQQVKYTPIDVNYMPEGYPSKSVQTTTLMEEQEVTFSKQDGLMGANSPADLEIKLGDKLTVVWDGVSYDVEVKKATFSSIEFFAFGNLGLVFPEDTTDYPFVYTESAKEGIGKWITSDTATSHTIKVIRQQVTITPMSADFIPPMKNLNVVFIAETGYIPTSCNVTYDELRGWVENNIPILSIYRRIDSDYTEIITTIQLDPDSLVLKTAINNGFTYNSDGTFSGVEKA